MVKETLFIYNNNIQLLLFVILQALISTSQYMIQNLHIFKQFPFIHNIFVKKRNYIIKASNNKNANNRIWASKELYQLVVLQDHKRIMLYTQKTATHLMLNDSCLEVNGIYHQWYWNIHYSIYHKKMWLISRYFAT